MSTFAAVALAAVGDLAPAGCVARLGGNPSGCAKTARGLGGSRSVAVSADGKSVYVAAGDDNAVVAFKRNTTTGALTQIGCVGRRGENFGGCSQTARGLESVGSVAVSADGKSVYAAAVGDNAVVAFRRNTGTGALTPLGCIADRPHNRSGCARTTGGLDGTQAVAVSRDGRSVYAVGAGPAGRTDEGIVRFNRAAGGALTPMGCIGVPGNNPDNCAQTAKGLDGAIGVTVSGDGRSVYVASTFASAIAIFKRNTTSGALTPDDCVGDASVNIAGCTTIATGVDSPWAVAVSADGRSVYVTEQLGNAISRFARDATSGKLAPQGCIGATGHNPDGCARTAPGLRGAEGVTISGDGRSVYVAGVSDSAVVAFSRSTATGSLTPAGCIARINHNAAGCPRKVLGLRAPTSVAASGDGRSLYATAVSDNAIVHFARTR